MCKMVIKRNGETVEFNDIKIINAILNANRDVSEDERMSKEEAREIAVYILGLKRSRFLIEDIQDIVEEKIAEKGHYKLAKEYILFRKNKEMLRNTKKTDEAILGLIKAENEELINENSNKNAYINSTQRDLIAGEVSKDIAKRLLLPKTIVEAHESGDIHYHDMDYTIQTGEFNCCLINIKDMLDNGTVMNGKMIESPKGFQVACTVMTQIISAVASSQYGGQSVNIKHLGKYLKKAYDKKYKQLKEKHPNFNNDTIKTLANEATQNELEAGVQTIQYQINTLMTTNGQSPFVTLFLELDEKDEYLDYTAKIIEEILRQRYEGIKNEKGIYVTPAFPKLIYVLDEHNCLKGGKYDYLTKLAVKCSSKRLYPDYISAKKMREIKEGNVFSPMGCRSMLSTWKDENNNYKFEGRFNQGVVSINLPRIAIEANQDEDKFWTILDERLQLCYEALMCRHNFLRGTKSDVSPIHWQYGAISRLKKGEKIDKLLYGGYSTISLGYIGVYEMTKAMKGVSHTTPEGREFSLKVLNYLEAKTEEWKKMTNIGFGVYGTPAESLCYRFARLDKEKFGTLEDITDKGYYTNSYHVDVREKINAFDKLAFESKYQEISSGGAISYIEIPNMQHNLEAMEEIVKFMYDNILYAEFNTKSDNCLSCGYTGEIKINENDEWYCPNCGNKDHALLQVTRRTCGYLGENFWNIGKTKEIKSRRLHI